MKKAPKNAQRIEHTKRNLVLIGTKVWDVDAGKWVHVCPVCQRVYHSERSDKVTCSKAHSATWRRWRKAIYGAKPDWDEANAIARKNAEFFGMQSELDL